MDWWPFAPGSQPIEACKASEAREDRARQDAARVAARGARSARGKWRLMVTSLPGGAAGAITGASTAAAWTEIPGFVGERLGSRGMFFCLQGRLLSIVAKDSRPRAEVEDRSSAGVRPLGLCHYGPLHPPTPRVETPPVSPGKLGRRLHGENQMQKQQNESQFQMLLECLALSWVQLICSSTLFRNMYRRCAPWR